VTWVIGMPTSLGFAIGISDICVSGNGWAKDCLQKIYGIGPGVAMAFAGTVPIGFKMVWTAHQLLKKLDAGSYQNLHTIWPSIAKDVFDSFDPVSQSGGCHVMLFVVDPIRNAGEAPWAYRGGAGFSDAKSAFVM
jgi:hypothetical protein